MRFPLPSLAAALALLGPLGCSTQAPTDAPRTVHGVRLAELEELWAPPPPPVEPTAPERQPNAESAPRNRVAAPAAGPPEDPATVALERALAAHRAGDLDARDRHLVVALDAIDRAEGPTTAPETQPRAGVAHDPEVSTVPTAARGESAADVAEELAGDPIGAEESGPWATDTDVPTAIDESDLPALLLAEPTPPEAAFRLEHASLARSVSGLGDFDPWPDVRVRPGQALWIYGELDGFAVELDLEGSRREYRSSFSAALVLRALDEREVTRRVFVRPGRGVLRGPDPAGTTCLWSRWTIPVDLAPGPYALEIVARDEIGGETSSASLPIEVRLEAPLFEVAPSPSAR